MLEAGKRRALASVAIAAVIATAVVAPGCGGTNNAPIPVITGPTGPTGFGEPPGLTATKDHGNSRP